MGLTMNQWDQLAGGAVEGYKGSQANRRDNRKDQREQDEEKREAEKWVQQEDANKTLQDRIAREEFEAIVQESAAGREVVDTNWSGGIKGPPAPGTPGGAPAAGTPGGAPAQGALPQPSPNIPLQNLVPPGPGYDRANSVTVGDIPPGTPGGAPPIFPGMAGAPRFAGGGPVGVAAEAIGEIIPAPVEMGPPQPQPQMGPPQPEALPTQPTQPAYKDRREEYNAWRKKAEAAHARAGGLEGLQMFRDQENALSRKQMLGYGMEGVTAMQAGNAGEAVKQLNTMLAVSPEDTGMEWQAYDGKVYLVGPNGKRGKPFNQAAVQAAIENNIKTPETYLAFQEQSRKRNADKETARRNLITEGIDQQKADSGTQIAETNESQYQLDKEYRGRETSVKEANALASLITAKSARERAAALLAKESNWTAAQTLKIYSDADTWSLTDEMIPKEMQKAYQEDPIAWGVHKSDVMNQMTKNNYDTGPTREEASAVSMFLRQPGGHNLNDQMNLGAAQDPNSGVVIVNYEGKEWALPYSLGVAALKLGIIQDAVDPPSDASSEEEQPPVGGGDKEDGAIPDGPPAGAGAWGAPKKVVGAIGDVLSAAVRRGR